MPGGPGGGRRRDPRRGPAVVVVPTPRDAEELVAGLALLVPERSPRALPAEALESYLGRIPPLGATAAAALALLGLAERRVRVLVGAGPRAALPAARAGVAARPRPALAAG